VFFFQRACVGALRFVSFFGAVLLFETNLYLITCAFVCPINRFYDHDYAVTEHGTLNLTTNAAHTYFNGLDDATGELVARTKNFKSAMLQGWNKVLGSIVHYSCFIRVLKAVQSLSSP